MIALLPPLISVYDPSDYKGNLRVPSSFWLKFELYQNLFVVVTKYKEFKGPVSTRYMGLIASTVQGDLPLKLAQAAPYISIFGVRLESANTLLGKVEEKSNLGILASPSAS